MMAETNSNPAAPPTVDTEPDDERERRPPDHHGSDHRHPRGWRIDPGPGGRGAPEGERPKPGRLGWRFLLLLAFLLAMNWWFVSTLPEPGPERVRIPYNPVFLKQVRAGNVKSIASKGATVQGELSAKLRYPPGDKSAEPTTKFKTEVPAFANQDRLSDLLERKGVVINAEPPEEDRSLLETLLLGFGPTLLLVALFVFLIRRAAGGMGGGIGGFGRSQARRIEPSQQRIDFDDVAGTTRPRRS